MTRWALGVQLIDKYTGRIMEDCSWEHGLHSLIEAKEGCPPTPQRDSLARISYQRFFRRYLRLSGMTGTMREMARELWSVYRLAVISIPTNHPLCRRRHPDRVYPTAAAKWKAVVEQIVSLHREGRPILVGTRSVAASEHLGRLAFRRAQRAAECLHSRMRRDLLKPDEPLDSTLAFSGRRE